MSAIIRLKRKQFGIFNVGANYNAMKSAWSAGNKMQALGKGTKMVGGALAKTGAIAAVPLTAYYGTKIATGYNALKGDMGSSSGLNNW